MIEIGYKFGLLPVMDEEYDQTFSATIDELRQYSEMLVRECANIAFSHESVDAVSSNAISKHFGLK